MKLNALVFACLVGSVIHANAPSQAPTPAQPTPASPGAPTPPGQRTPPRAARPGEDPQKGTVILRGYVIAADTGSPLRRALVNAWSQNGRTSGMTTTDAQGRFEIKDLLAGRYTLNASKAGYVGMAYGQRRPEQPGTVLEVVDGQTVEKIGFSLPRGGVITGRVSDEFGDPIAGAQVMTHRFRYANGGRRLMPAGGGGQTTDDQGAFRLYGLAPGEYYVSATMRMQSMGGPNVQSAIVEGYAPTYFPGTPNAGEAQRVLVKVAQETTDISFSLAATRLVQLNGRAVSSSGEPQVQAFVSLMSTDRFAFGMPGMGSATTRADGTFQISGVAPGTYNLMLRPRGTPDAGTEFGNLRLTVGPDNIDNLLLVTSRGATAYGVITSDDGTVLPARPLQANVFARSLDPELMAIGGQAKVNDDWTFEITGLSEARLISAGLADSPDWSLKAVYLNGQDVTDSGVEFVPGRNVEGFQIVFSRKRTDVSGGITDDRGRPETDATIIIFAEDRARWTVASRFVRTARPDQDGRYNVKGMPPQDYLLVAVRTIEPGQWQDPDYLESIRDQAMRISLGEGETRVQDLKVAKQ